MIFNVFGSNAVWQWSGWILVLVGLLIVNEIARRSRLGGIVCFIFLPIALTIYFIVIYVAASNDAQWAIKNQTYEHMTSWFHYAKLYAATLGCIGFMILKYRWGKLGNLQWFKAFPFIIVAVNILIAVISEFESAIRAFGTTWLSTEGVVLHGGWHNVFNGTAGILNIFVMTGYVAIYSSKKRQDMLWPDMTWVFIISYDIWNFTYTYNCLPTHSFYAGLALLLAPTIANYFWNRGAWIQNRAFTLAIWCMFAQVYPVFLDESRFSADSVNNNNINLAFSVVSLLANIAAICYVIYRSKKLGVNPYKHPVFVGTRDSDRAMARREDDPVAMLQTGSSHLRV